MLHCEKGSVQPDSDDSTASQAIERVQSSTLDPHPPQIMSLTALASQSETIHPFTGLLEIGRAQ